MKKIYLVPNFVTTLNLFWGFYSVIASISHQFPEAAWAIIFAAIFDMLDGRIARLAKATSEFGVQYDSMSDLVSFGMAPGVLLYQWSLEPYGRLGWLACFLFLACGALRLARFNCNSQTLPKGFFQGLPIPMAAGMVSTFILFSMSTGLISFSRLSSLILTFTLASLMVSTIPFPSFKELNWRSRVSFGYLLVGVLGMILIAVRPEVTLFLLLSAYVVVSLLWNLARATRGQEVGMHSSSHSGVQK